MAPRLLLLLAVVGSLGVAVVAGGDGGSKILQPLKLSCSTDSNYSESSQYHKNLDQLLSTIPMAAAGNGGFYNGTFGMAPDEVFGLFMCYADAADDGFNKNLQDACQECLTRAPAEIMQLCPGSRTARAIYDAGVLLYSDVSFSVAGELSPASFYVQGRGTRSWTYGEYSPFGPPFVVDAAAINRTRSELIASLVVSAAHSRLRLARNGTLCGGDPSMYSRGMYVFVQCRRDLPASECTRCLSGYAARLPRLFPNNSAGAIKGYSCFVMYDVATRNPPLVQLPSEWEEQPPQVQRAVPSFGRPERRHRLPAVAAVVGVSADGVAFVLCLSLSVSYLLHRQKQWRTEAAAEKSELEQPLKEALHFRGRTVENELELGTGPRRFSYGELADATDNFADGNKLGEGAFGSVYLGFLSDGSVSRDVAVKRVAETSRQGWREFVAEVRIISRLRHRNLVQLIGWCHDHDGGDELLLVYELMLNGSLEGHIYSAENVMPWPVRYEVVLGVLHEETTEQCVLHRDIKPSNVMLDASFNAKLGNFGLARLVGDGRRSRTTGAAGTLGYMDPGCVSDFTASVEADVYSFGVVLLEVACGRRPAVPTGDGDGCVVHLAQWVWARHGGGAILEMADVRLDGEFDGQEMECVLAVGLWCAHPDRALRPSVRQAVGFLRFQAPLPTLSARMPVATYTTPPAAANSAGGDRDDDIGSSCSISWKLDDRMQTRLHKTGSLYDGCSL